MNVGIINYGVGNLGSIVRAVDEIGHSPVLIKTPENLTHCHKLILPGVGNFTDCKNILDRHGWTAGIQHAALTQRIPILGICLGMQLLADSGYEGASAQAPTNGLGLIHGEVVSLKTLGCQQRIPHIGWNSITKIKEHALLGGMPSESDFYFVHSYAFLTKDITPVLATTSYGVTFPVAIAQGNIWGVQFHPEKSSKIGLQVLKNFTGNT